MHLLLSSIVSSMLLYSSSSKLPLNRIGYASRIWLSNSQVTSSGLRCFHCTFTCPMVRVRSKISLLSRIESGSTKKSPSGSTYTSFQFITWVASCTYLFKTEIWKTLWNFRLGGKSSWNATCPILDNISKGPQYLGANLAQLPNFKELFLGLTFMKTCSPTWNDFWVRLRFDWLFYLSCATFKLPCTCFTINSISFNSSSPSTNL